MDSKLLLVKTITLLYLNSKLLSKNSDAIEIAKEVLEIVKPRDKMLAAEFGSTDPINELRETLSHMAQQGLHAQYEESELKQRFMLSLKGNEAVYEALLAGMIIEDADEDKLQNRYNHQKAAIRSILNKNKITDVLKNYYVKTARYQDTVDYKTLLTELNDSLMPYVSGATAEYNIESHPSIVGNVDFSVDNSVSDVFKSAQEELDVSGVIKTPYQGFNRMMGNHGGFLRGETAVITALTHNYKSGLCLDVFAFTPTVNKPYMRDPSKKPLNLRLTLENKLQQDFAHMYTKMYETEFKVKSDIREISIDEATAYLMERLRRNGYESRIVHIDPTDFTYADLFKLIEHYEEQGFEIHIITVDYLNMMSKAGCSNGAAGEDVRDLFRRARNFFLRRGIALVTPHQFSTEGRKIQRSDPRDFVKEVSGKGYYDSCSRLEQELDLEISLHIVKHNDEQYLTAMRGKHRGVVTPPRDLYCVYKFEEIGGIPVDWDGEDQSRRSIGGNTMAEGGQASWMDSVL